MRASRRVEIANRIRAADAICVDFAALIAHSGDPFARFVPLLGRGGAAMSAIDSKKKTHGIAAVHLRPKLPDMRGESGWHRRS